MASTEEVAIKLSNSKNASEGIFSLNIKSARDEFGTEYILKEGSLQYKRIHTPKIENGEYICINFSESIAIQWMMDKNTRIEFTVYSENESIKDVYNDKIFFDDRRVV